jgi:peptidoglycan hydrolase-like protein with peptidoglycan-binding domain
MANPGQPTIRLGDTGEPVRQAQRALRRTPNLTLKVDGIFGTPTENATKDFQRASGLTPDGIIGEKTWNALPDGSPMPTLKDGSAGDEVRSLQEVLTRGAKGQWETTPKGVDGKFGPNTTASVRAFQTWAGVAVDGIVGQQTWDAATSLEGIVGLQYIVVVKPA